MLSGEVGLGERFSLQGALPVRTVDITGRGDYQEEGMGDLALLVRTALTDPEGSRRFAAVAFYGASLPTGKDSDPEILQQNAQFSLGVWAAIAGGEINLRLGEKVAMAGRALVQVPVGENDGYRFAGSRTASALFSGPIASSPVTWLGGLEIRYSGQDTWNLPDDGMGPVDVPNRGGHQTRALGGLLFALKRGHNLGVTAGYLLAADLPGDQLTARTEIVVGWQGSFGSHRHAGGHED